MKLPICDLGDNPRVALTPGTRSGMHANCAGAFIDGVSGKVVACSCACHDRDPLDLAAVERAGLQVMTATGPDGAPTSLADPPPAGGPGSGDQDAGDGAGDVVLVLAPTGRCEHCGEPCGGRFLPGHDAKLKADLATEADQGDPFAWAELSLRGWAKLISRAKVPEVVRAAGEELADEVLTAVELAPNEWLAERCRARWDG